MKFSFILDQTKCLSGNCPFRTGGFLEVTSKVFFKELKGCTVYCVLCTVYYVGKNVHGAGFIQLLLLGGGQACVPCTVPLCTVYCVLCREGK
jgi:hypothetical protein